MSSNTTAIERLLEVSNQLWDAMYESGEVPTHAERSYYYLALKDAMDENAKLREFASEAFSMAFNFYHGAGTAEDLRELTVEYRELGIEAEQ